MEVRIYYEDTDCGGMVYDGIILSISSGLGRGISKSEGCQWLGL